MKDKYEKIKKKYIGVSRLTNVFIPASWIDSRKQTTPCFRT